MLSHGAIGDCKRTQNEKIIDTYVFLPGVAPVYWRL